MNEKKSKTELIVDLEKALKKIKNLEKKLNEQESGVSEKVKFHSITTKKSRKDKSPVISEIALLKTLFEVIPLPVFTKNIDGKYTGCNKAFERFLGRKRDEIIGKSVYDISSREIAQKYEMMDNELFRSGGEQIYEWIVEDSSGNEKNVLFHKACYSNADGNVEGLIGAISDISERKRGETLVKKSEYFFRSIWEKSSEGMRLTDKNGVTVLVNQAFCDLSGKTREELEGNSLAEIYFTEDRKNILENYKKRYAENKIEQHFSRKIKLWNKKELWFAVSTSSLDIGDGNPLVLSIFLDITERKRIEEVLVEKENYYRTILHSLQEDIIVIDADYTVTDINNSYLKTTGLTRKEAIGKKCYEITHQIKEPCNKRGKKCPLLEVFKTGNPQRCVHIHKDADGKEVHIDILMSPYKDRKGKVTHVVETSRNITEFLIAQDVIKKGEALYRTILYSIGDAIITTDTHGKVMQMNKIAEKITGYSEKEVMNHQLSTFFKIINEETRVAVENPVDKVLKENIVVGLANHTILISKDGKEIPIADSGAPIIDNSGNTIGVVLVFRDQTKEREAENRLTESEKKYRQLITQTNRGIALHEVICNKKGEVIDYRFLEANDAFFHLTGLNREETIGKTVLEVLPGTEKYWIEKYGEVALKGKSVQFENYSKELNKYFEVVAYSPQPKQFATIVSDISIRKKQEKEISGAHEVFKKTFHNSPIPSSLTRVNDLVLTDVNDAFCQAIGYKKEEIINKPTTDFNIWVNLKSRQFIVMKVIGSGSLKDYEFEFRTKNGEIRYGLGYFELIEINNEKYILGNILDITDRKQSEKLLQENEEKFRSYINNSPHGIYLVNAEGRYIDVNPGAEKQVEYSKEEMLQMHITDLVRDEDLQKGKEHFNQLLREGEAVGEFRFYTKTGSHLDVVLKAKKISENLFIGVATDITEIKKTEEALRKSEEKYRNYFERDISGDYLSTPGGKLVDCNPAFAQMLGYDSVEEILSVNTETFYPYQSDRQKFIDKLTDAKLLVNYEFDMMKKDGSIIHCMENVVGVFNDRNELIEFQGYVLDITERKRAEEQLRRERERLENIIKGTNTATWEWNVQTGETIYNERWAEMIGYTLDEISPVSIETWMNFAHPEDLKKSNELLEKHFNGELEYYEFESRMRHKNGNWIWVLDRGKVFSWTKDGKPIMMMGTHQDITERKREQELLSFEARYRQVLMEHSKDGIVILDQDGRVFESNKKFAEMLGYPLESMHRLSVFDWEFLHTHEQVIEMIRSVDESGDNFETKHRRKDGSIYDVEISTNASWFKGQKLIFCICRDITDRKQAEEIINEERKRLNFVMEVTHTHVNILDKDFNLRYVDPAWQRIYGDPKGRKCYEYFKDRYKKCEDCGVPKAFETNRVVVYEEFLPKENRIIEVHTIPIQNEEGEWLAAEFNIDITKRKQAEEELKISQERTSNLNTLLNAILESPQDMVVFALDTNCCYTAFTKAHKLVMKKLWGVNIKEGDNMLDYISLAEDRNKAHDNFKRCLSGEFFILEEEYGVPSLQRTYFETRYSPLFNEQREIIGLTVFNIDITERKQAEEALKESEERFNLAMRASNDGLFDWNLITNEIYYSPRWKSILGYEDHEIPNDFSVWETNTDPEDVKKSWELQRKLITNQIDRFVIEFKMKHKDGHWVDILSRAEAIFDETGKAVRMVGTHTDITERKRAEEVLRQSEALLANSQQIAHLGSWRFDVHANRLYWSDEVFRIFGCEPQEFEVTYEDFLGFVHPDDRDAVNDAYSHSVQEVSEFGEMEHRIIRKSTGEVRFVHQRGVFEFDDAGTVIRSIGMVHDITERKLIEEHLRQFQNIVSSTTDGIAFLDKEYRYIIVNDAYERFSGIKKEIFVGRNITEYLGKDVFEQVVKPHFDKCLQGETITYQDWFEFPSLGRRFVEVTYSPYRDVRNNISGVLSNTRDITERKLAEEALRESEEKHRRLFETMSPGVVYQDADGKILSANPASERILHISLKQMKDKTSWDPRWRMILEDGTYVPGSEHPAMISLRIGEKIGPVIRGIFIPEKNEYVWLSITAVPVFNEGEEKPHQVYSTFEDITERKRAEEALRERDKQYFTLLESLSDSVYVLDSEMRHIIVNEAATQFVQMPREKLLGNKLTNLFPGIEKTDFFQVFKKVLETRESDVVISEFHFEDGRKGWYEVHVDPVPEGILCISRDITERKRAEEALRISENRFHDLFERAPLGYQSLDENGCFIEVNEAWLDILGYSREEVIEAWFGDFLAPEYVQTFQENFPSFKSAGRISVEFEMLTKNRVRRWISFVGRIAYKPDGSIMQTHCILQDITESKKVGEALRNSQKEYAFLAQTASELLTLSSIADIYDYTATKLYELLDKNCIVAIVEYETDRNIWKMKKIVGISDNLIKITGVLGFSPEKFEGEISTKLYEKVLSGKLVELEFNFPILFNNKLSEKVGEILKKMLSIDKLFSISFQQNNQLLGNISLIMKKGSKELNSSLIEAFVNQVTNFLKKQKAEQEIINKMNEINRFNKLMVGREHKMIELKKEVNQLLAQNGLPKKYKIDEQTE